jgi:hypothetical protein
MEFRNVATYPCQGIATSVHYPHVKIMAANVADHVELQLGISPTSRAIQV